MGFAVGETVGSYLITAYIGQGGMATIYKAHQLTLDRDVALKVIHPALKEDPSFLTRLNREAAIVAKLDHPNIVPIYDLGDYEGIRYLVMRFIEGKTLKVILQERKLKTDEILDIAHSVGAALTFAHSHGVLHRDVKPSNVIIDLDGHVYLTDFGLARITDSSDSTLSRDMLIGSPQYISPEQAKGETVDERSDVYSLGVVLFEMFTGRVPFARETPYATIMAHINDPLPSPRSICQDIPPAVEKVLERALAKRREHRYSSVSELVTALTNAVNGPQAAEDEGPPILLDMLRVAPRNLPHFRPRAVVAKGLGPWARSVLTQLSSDKRAAGAGALLLVVCLLGAGLLSWGLLQSWGLLGAPSLHGAGWPAAAVGQAIATPTRLPSATQAPVPVVPFTPTPPPAPTPSPSAAAPAVDLLRGKIAYSLVTGDLPEQYSIWIANGDGTDAHRLIEMAMWPALSPDGTQIAYYRKKSTGIYVADSDGNNPRQVLASQDACCVQWSPDSKRLLFFEGKLKFGGSMYIMDPDGSNLTEIGPGFNPAWSSDGSRIAYASCQPNSSLCGLYVMELKTKSSRMITRDAGGNPQWSPRGDRIVYQADDGHGHVNVFVINADGTGARQLTFGSGNDGQPVWSRDGSHIYWRSDQNGTGWGLYVMRTDGSYRRLLIDKVPAEPDLWGRESLTSGP